MGYRSGLEKQIQNQLNSLGVAFTYESLKVPFIIPERLAHYTVDFILPNGIVIESKGRFMTADRKKHLLVKAAFPGLELRFVFSRANSPIYKGSKTTYKSWAEKNGFMWAEKLVPPEWIKEKPHKAWLMAIEEISKSKL